MFRRHVWLAALTSAALGLLGARSARADEPNWVGKKVIVRNKGVRVAYTDIDGSRRLIPNKNIVQEVRSEVGGWLEVGNDGDPGWLDKSDVVPLDQAPAFFAARLEANPFDQYAYAYRGVALRHLGELDKSVSDLSEAIRLSPGSAAWRNNRGLTFNNKKEYDLAIADFTEAIRLNPRWALPRNNRGLAHANKKEFDLAVADYSDSLRLDPGYALALNNRGLAYYAKHEFDRAIDDYGAAILLDEKNPRSYNNRGNAYRAKGEFERAVNDFNEAILLDGKYAAAYDNVAKLQSTCAKDSVRDGRQAILNATNACKLTNYTNSNYLATLAAAYAEDGQFGEAAKWQNKVLDAPGKTKAASADARQRLELYQSGKPLREMQ
jgi:tetratricopeptide (TPR) repeat protein